MATVNKPAFQILYNSKDITRDISPFVVALNYTDAVQGKTDTIEIKIEDSAGDWRDTWYPKKGDKLTIFFGYVNQLVPAGSFQIDEIEFSGPPDALSINAKAAGVTVALRTKTNSAHENKTLEQIANSIGKKHGLTVEGAIDAPVIERVTQHRETDLCFLSRLAAKFGYVFTVRDSKLIFTEVYGLEFAAPENTLNRADLISYQFHDKMVGTYQAARVRYHNPGEGKNTLDQGVATAIRYRAVGRKRISLYDAPTGVTENTLYRSIGRKRIAITPEENPDAAADQLEVYDRAENKGQAEAMADAALHETNTNGVTGTITVPGSPLLLAGSNISLIDMGVFSGIWHIKESQHAITPGGYVTTLDIKQIEKKTDI